MAPAKQGDTIKANYTGRLEDGAVFDSSENREPLQFVIGEGRLIPGFEAAVLGMNPGETKTVKIPADEAYGLHIDELVMKVDKKMLPPGLEPKIGQQLELKQQNGELFLVEVKEVAENFIVLDGNHPLAGKDLTFEIRLEEIS